jgi:hypothetical protein
MDPIFDLVKELEPDTPPPSVAARARQREALMRSIATAGPRRRPTRRPQPQHRLRTRPVTTSGTVRRSSPTRSTIIALVAATALAAVAIAAVNAETGHTSSGHTPPGTPRAATPPPTGSNPPATHLNTRSISYVVGRVQAALDADNDRIFYQQVNELKVSGAIGLFGRDWMTPGAAAARHESYSPVTGQPDNALFGEKGGNVVMVSYTTATTGTWIDEPPGGPPVSPNIYFLSTGETPPFQIEFASSPTGPSGPGIQPPTPAFTATDASQLGAGLRSLLTAGNLTLVGPGAVNGEKAIELQIGAATNYQTAQAMAEDDQKADIWVDATTYLPIQADSTWNANAPDLTKNGKNPVTPQTFDGYQANFQWLPPTPANLAQVTRAATVPVGFTQDILVPISGPNGRHGRIEVPAPTTTVPPTTPPASITGTAPAGQ